MPLAARARRRQAPGRRAGPLVAARDPTASVEWRKASRQGRLLLDTATMDGFAPAVARPHSVRVLAAVAGATPIGVRMGRVDHPIAWCQASLRRPPGPQARPMGHTGDSFRSRSSWPTCWPASAMPPGRPGPLQPRPA